MRRTLAVAVAVVLLVLAGGTPVPAASTAGTGVLPSCSDLLSDREAKLVSTGDRITAADHTVLDGFLTCNWLLASGRTSFLLDVGALWIEPKTPQGRKNLNFLGRTVCGNGPAAACDARDDLLEANTAAAAFRVLYRWWDGNGTASSPFRIGSDLASWLEGKTDLYLLVAGGHAGVLLHTACARVAKSKSRVPFAACTKEAMRFTRANLRGWLKTR